MRENRKQYFDGNGDYSAKQAARLVERLQVALSTLSYMQQPPRPCDPADSGIIYKKFCAKGKKEVMDIAKDIFVALTGKEVVSVK